MHYCSQCRLKVRGSRVRCVLCGKSLSASVEPEGSDDVFPDIPPDFESHLAIRILVFISFTAVVASFAIRMIFPTETNWPLFVIFGLVSLWLGLIIVVRKRHNTPKIIMWQVAVISLLSVFWDWQTGWHGWSLDYLIPIVYVAAELVMYITAKIMKLGIREYLTYALLDGLFGILPVLFILFHWVKFLYPSILCAAFSAIFLAAIFIFQGDQINKELKKKMHI
jgi:hypothetical protein